MTDYREQAIKDMRSCYNLKDFAVSQRERVLRLEAALRQIESPAGSWLVSPAENIALMRDIARAALEAVKEG